MNYRDVTQETSSIWSVDAIESIKFIQDSNIEAFKNIGYGVIGSSYDPTKMYVLGGLVNSTPGTGTFTISAGAVFFNGEVYTVDAATITPSIGVVVAKVNDVGSGTLIKFSDNSTKDILHIKKVVLVDAVSSSGDANFSDFVLKGSVRQYDSVPSGTVATSQTVIHNIVPSLFNIKKMLVNYSGNFSTASTLQQIVLRLWVGATITSHTSGTISGTISGGTNIKTIGIDIVSTSIAEGIASFAFMFDYIGGQNVTITIESSGGTAAVIANGSDFMVS